MTCNDGRAVKALLTKECSYALNYFAQEAFKQMDLKIKYWDPRWEMLHSTDGVPYKENKQTLDGLRLTNTDDEALVSSGNTHKCTYQCWLWDATWMQAIHGAIYVEWGCPQRWHSCFKSNIYFTLCQGSVPPFRAFTCVASGKTSRRRSDEWGTDEPQSVFWKHGSGCPTLMCTLLQHAN